MAWSASKALGRGQEGENTEAIYVDSGSWVRW